MNIILFEDTTYRNQLKPLTLTRPIGNLRVGILTINEKWEKKLNARVSFLTEAYLQKKFAYHTVKENIYINASFLPTSGFEKLLKSLEFGECIKFGEEVVAYASDRFGDFDNEKVKHLKEKDAHVLRILPDLFTQNRSEIGYDFALITKGRLSQKITDPYTKVYSANNIFIEKGANFKACVLNAEEGPIYIGKDAVIQEGAVVIGPAAICEKSMVAFGARIRPNTTLGPACRVGGEVGNSIFYAFSNKAHDGFLGNSYIGEWCNLGANTNNSNLKNDYKEVKLYNYDQSALVDTKELFCGTFMGDYTKAGISTMFNTGTVVGVSSNVFGAGFQEKFIPSFTWGGKAEGYSPYRFEKALEVINATMSRRETKLSADDEKILSHILENKKPQI
ncbi:putative sugar nucleotidyl transferase [Arcticibacterium luteifluviistationis]|uniref:Glucose-1-phosphate thymidylyltransferase n=1 Tax=Arcticibacterium luteifluviistationis TaxID=1784714 RepID=A0A2Z4GA84_9BACT|nr:putative sugar nucleotidyl transferase [Arcticibacterium luteifluviistationis]AWV97968.1 glucose-1-phosphate thymidylyltransferase [Arcticibacterium luteifluviistationis]